MRSWTLSVAHHPFANCIHHTKTAHSNCAVETAIWFYFSAFVSLLTAMLDHMTVLEIRRFLRYGKFHLHHSRFYFVMLVTIIIDFKFLQNFSENYGCLLCFKKNEHLD